MLISLTRKIAVLPVKWRSAPKITLSMTAQEKCSTNSEAPFRDTIAERGYWSDHEKDLMSACFRCGPQTSFRFVQASW